MNRVAAGCLTVWLQRQCVVDSNTSKQIAAHHCTAICCLLLKVVFAITGDSDRSPQCFVSRPVHEGIKNSIRFVRDIVDVVFDYKRTRDVVTGVGNLQPSRTVDFETPEQIICTLECRSAEVIDLMNSNPTEIIGMPQHTPANVIGMAREAAQDGSKEGT